MTDEEMGMEELAAGELARVLEVSPRTLQHWLKTGELEGRQTFTGRWLVKVGNARSFIKRKARDDGSTETRFDTFLHDRFQQEKARC